MSHRNDCEGLLGSVLDALPFHIAVLDRNGIITSFNATWRRFAKENGDPPEKTIGIGADYLAVCRRATGTFSDGASEALQGIESVLDGRQSDFTIEYACHSPSQHGWFVMNVTPLAVSGSGAVVSHMSITNRKLAEEALRENEERFRSFVETTNEWIWAVDLEGTLTYSNPAVEAILGYKVADLLGRNIHTLIDDQAQAEIVRSFHAAVENKQGWSGIETRWRCKDGSYRYLECNAVPAFDAGGNLVGFRGADRDVTERKFLEEELIKSKKLESVGILAGGIAHDFNNLLAAIMGNIGYAEMLADKESKLFEVLKDAEKACVHTAQLTKELITFAKGGEPIRKAVPIGDLVRDTAKMTCDITESECVFRIPENLWAVAIDDGQLRQVIHNILQNAVEAATGRAQIEIAVENTVISGREVIPLGKGNYVKISIRDRGAGIAKEDLPRVFDPYFTTREVSGRTGMGLGLSVCHSIIRKHEGFIGIESEKGAGATVYFYIPALEQKEPGDANIP